MTECFLYRHYDEAGQLAYVGISIDAITRQGAHERRSPWFKSVRRIEITPFPSREAALEAEAEAIRVEKPSHNRQHSLDPSQPRLGAFIISDSFEAGRSRSRSRRHSP